MVRDYGDDGLSDSMMGEEPDAGEVYFPPASGNGNGNGNGHGDMNRVADLFSVYQRTGGAAHADVAPPVPALEPPEVVTQDQAKAAEKTTRVPRRIRCRPQPTPSSQVQEAQRPPRRKYKIRKEKLGLGAILWGNKTFKTVAVLATVGVVGLGAWWLWSKYKKKGS